MRYPGTRYTRGYSDIYDTDTVVVSYSYVLYSTILYTEHVKDPFAIGSRQGELFVEQFSLGSRTSAQGTRGHPCTLHSPPQQHFRK